jgi:hypothetical protein
MDILLGEVIAERHLEWADDSGPSEGVIVRIGKPVQDTDPDGDWLCPIQILGLGRDHVRAAFGVDAVQALTLSFQMIHADLLAGQRQVGRALQWLEQSDLGFLLPPARH